MKLQELTTWELICQEVDINPELPDLSYMPFNLGNYMVSQYQAVIATRAINGCDKENKLWKPDYTDKNQIKYEIYVWVDADKNNPSGFGFTYTGYVCTLTDAASGARLCFETREKAMHFIKYFMGVLKHQKLYID